jgi:hypothetical protein
MIKSQYDEEIIHKKIAIDKEHTIFIKEYLV